MTTVSITIGAVRISWDGSLDEVVARGVALDFVRLLEMEAAADAVCAAPIARVEAPPAAKKVRGGKKKQGKGKSARTAKAGNPAPPPPQISPGAGVGDNILATLSALGGKATTAEIRQRLVDEEVALKDSQPGATLNYLKGVGRIDKRGDQWVMR